MSWVLWRPIPLFDAWEVRDEVGRLGRVDGVSLVARRIPSVMGVAVDAELVHDITGPTAVETGFQDVARKITARSGAETPKTEPTDVEQRGAALEYDLTDTEIRGSLLEYE